MMENAFEDVNHARCFNHTLQLSAKVLLSPFNAGMSPMKLTPEEEFNNLDCELQTLQDKDTISNDDGDNGEDGDDDGYDASGVDTDGSDDTNDDKLDELDQLDEKEQEKILVDTAIVRQTITKVRSGYILLIVDWHGCRSGNYHLRSFIRQPLCSRPGKEFVPNLGSSHVLYLVTSSPSGTWHMIWCNLYSNTEDQSMPLWQIRSWSWGSMSLITTTGRSLKTWLLYFR